MSEAIIIGGFVTSRRTLDDVCEVASSYYDHIKPLTLNEAIDLERRAKLTAIVAGRTVLTHSVGIVPLSHQDIIPHALVSISPPVPRPVSGLIKGSVLKTIDMAKPDRRPSGYRRKAKYLVNSTIESLANLSANQGLIEQISKFDSPQIAAQKSKGGVAVTYVEMQEDRFFSLSDQARRQMVGARVSVISLPGCHDELLLYPETVVSQVLNSDVRNTNP